VHTIFQIFAARPPPSCSAQAEAERHKVEETYRHIIQTTDEGFLLMDRTSS